MPKPNPLTQGLKQRSVTPTTDQVQPVGVAKPSAAPSRLNRVLIAGHFAPAVQTALKILAAEERTTVQKLLAEGINTVLAKRGRPEIADISA